MYKRATLHTESLKHARCDLRVIHKTIKADLLKVCGRYRVADIDMWPIWTLPVADLVFSVADIAVADMVCGRYRCNSLPHLTYSTATCRN